MKTTITTQKAIRCRDCGDWTTASDKTVSTQCVKCAWTAQKAKKGGK